MTLSAGLRLGSYEILSDIGAGGMGEVYRARDTRLHRDVAVKVLLPPVANDPDRLARFGREARLLASLNHPNIAQVHGLEESSGVRALIMELVEGPTLADRIGQGPIALDDALPIAKQIAEALAAAHEQGIIHRDLKPANIKVRPDGTVKVLDFGLAKALDQDVRHTETSGLAEMPTITAAGATVAGVILGTAPYMAPEQAKGRPVDRRADLWAFGCVLFEMLAGRRVFDGDTASAVLLNVVEQEPDWHALPAKTPASIRTLLRHCLEKDPKRRLDSAAVARIEIDEALTKPVIDPWRDLDERKQGLDAGVRASRPRSHAGRLMKMPFAMLAVSLVAITVLAWLFMSRENPSVLAVPHLQNAVQVTSSLDVESYPTWSPDGVRLAYQASAEGYLYSGNHDIWVAQLGSGEPVNLTKGHPANDRMPSWSPDGREIAFFSDRDGVWGLYTVAAIGGNPRNVLSLPGIGNTLNWSAPQWSRDGTKLFVSAHQGGENVVIVLFLGSLETTRLVLPKHEGNVCWDLSVSPDGRRFAYVEGGEGATEVTRLWTIPTSGGEAVLLTDGRTNVWSPTWSRDGSKVFYVSNRGGSMDLWQQTIAQDGTAVGEPLAVTHGLGIRSASFSPDGSRLTYTRGGRVGNVWRAPIRADRPATWADASQVTFEHAFIEFVDVSPDGKLLAVSSNRRGNQDLWVLPAAGGEMTPLTTDPTPDWNPRWSPDGKEIAFYAYRSGNRDIWVMPSGGGPARQLTSHPGQDWYPSWSPDGREIAFQSVGTGATMIVAAQGGEPRPLAPGIGSRAEWSPDGPWLLVAREGRLYRVARDGGEPLLLPATVELPFWHFSRDAQSIYYSIFTGPRENQDFWKLSLRDGKVSRLTKLEGRRGRLGEFAADARNLYFTWHEDEGDIWVMDVVTGQQ